MRAVARRTREIGIRMALGAEPRARASVGVAPGDDARGDRHRAGLAASAYLARFLASMLYGVDALDAPTLAATAAVSTCGARATLRARARATHAVDAARAALKRDVSRARMRAAADRGEGRSVERVDAVQHAREEPREVRRRGGDRPRLPIAASVIPWRNNRPKHARRGRRRAPCGSDLARAPRHGAHQQP